MTTTYEPPTRQSVRPEDLNDSARSEITRQRRGDTPSLGRRWLRAVRDFVQLIAVALVLAFVLKTFLLQAFYIPSGSMLETLQIQDRVLVEKLSYRFREPQRGEIIVFRRPGREDEGLSLGGTVTSFMEGLGLVEPDEDRDLIKRVIALPGETVEMINGVVHINGMPLEEDYTAPETRSFPPVQVPEGRYYVLGDNRGNSLDSRFALGTIPEANVIGRAFVILWPPGSATASLDRDYPGVGETPVEGGVQQGGGQPDDTPSGTDQ